MAEPKLIYPINAISEIVTENEVPIDEAKKQIVKQKLLNNFIQTQNLIKTQNSM